MKILVVCQHFYPENFRINDECFELAKKGNEVTVLTGLPNYPTGVIEKEYKSRKKREEVVNGVTIKRCKIIGRGSSIARMALNYASFAINGSIKAIHIKGNFDIIYSYQLSPISMVWPGIVVKKIKKAPLVIHCLDQWPISVTTGPIRMNGLLYKVLKAISTWTYKQADTITVSSNSFKNYFKKEHGITEIDKGLIYIPSYAEDVYLEVGQVENEKFDVVFAGNVGPAQSCETIVESARILKYNEKIMFHIVGDGLSLSHCKKLAKEYDLKNIVFHGYHPIDEMGKYYSIADAFLITMQDNEVVNSTLPAKLQSYMMAGKPIIGAISGEVKNVVEKSDCGVCTVSGDYVGLANIIESLCCDKERQKKMGANAKEFYENNFEKKHLIDKRIKIFEECVLKKSKKNYQ